ncbi:sulfite exporter TauE/SafE family protein [Pedobacter sandarakinus]|uniref:sulfite exporter TauE/SafE family protein n=1 Tax=Pedobacter sandarakinus TaxID=353156 RepID=UPI002246F69A|nr:sulfite exporter TauE/SafE family protein [Pedobacter sandarakinus]MCX2574930.1 sulfite exporter TauE/SafE family protein [Pedobacter sandarakinus]
MEDFPLAFLMGFFGSVHCAVMCGPMMLSLPFQKAGILPASFRYLLYQFGRITTYTCLGLVVGSIGGTIKLFTNQQALTLFLGILLVCFTMLQFVPRYLKRFYFIQNILLNPISSLMGKVLNWPFAAFFVGSLNGIIPCGMVYLALATAINTGSTASGAKFMFLFGLGTTPLMIMVSMGGIMLKRYFAFRTRILIPWASLMLGLLLILRSANLGIPYVSPAPIGRFGEAKTCK